MLVAERRGLGAAHRRHAQHLRHGRHVVLDHAGHAMGAQHQLQLLQHVAVVVDAGLVEPDRGVDALLLEEVQRRHARAQAEVGRAVVADAALGRGQAVDVLLVQPHAVAERQAVVHHAEAVDVFQRRALAAPPGVFLLVGGLDQVHVHRHVVLGRGVAERRQRLVGAPVQVGRRELDLHPALVVVLRMERLEHVHRVVEAHLEAVEPALHRALQLLRQARPRTPRRPGRRAGSGRARRSSSSPACRHPRRRG